MAVEETAATATAATTAAGPATEAEPAAEAEPTAREAAAARRVGIIGVGEIAVAMVEGLCEGVAEPPAIFLSPRGAEAAARLADRYPSVEVCADNQEVVDRAALTLLAVRREQRAEALGDLTVGAEKVLVSVLAGVGIDELRRMLGTEAPILRAIPLPAARHRASLTVTHPSHPAATALFDLLGGTLVLPDEDALNVFSALTGTFTAHYWYLATLSEWAARHGVPEAEAERYVRGLFQNVGAALGDTSRSLPQLAAAHETPNGNNERIRTTWFDERNAALLHAALDGLLADLS